MRLLACSLVGDSHDLAKHDSGVAVQEGNAGQTLAGLEVVHDQGLAGLKDNLSHLVGLEAVGLLQLLATGLLADLWGGGWGDGREGGQGVRVS
jgi:hypothetical protein